MSSRTLRWHRLRKKSESLWAPSLRGRLKWYTRFHPCNGCPTSRFVLFLDGKPLWDYPMSFFDDGSGDPLCGRGTALNRVVPDHYGTDPLITMQWYLDKPRDDLFSPMIEERRGYKGRIHTTDYDEFDLGDILRACDRRIGFKRLSWWALFELGAGSPARKVLAARFEGRKGALGT